MSRQTELMAISESKTSKRFKFTLQNASRGLITMRYAPGGWESAKFEIKRNEKYWGLFRSISFNELIFLKDGRDFIKDVYELQGINANIVFAVYRWDDATQAYLNYYTGKIDLSTYKIDETGVSCQVIDTSFTEKVKNRENTTVNLKSLTSIEGFSIPAFATEAPRLEFPAYNIVATAQWLINSPDPITTLDAHYCPLLLTTSEFTEAQSQTIEATDPMFLSATAPRTVNLSGTISGIVNASEEVHHLRFRLELWVNGVTAATWAFEETDSTFVTFAQTIDEDFTVNLGADISLRGQVISGGTTNQTEYYDVQLALNEVIETVAASTASAWPYYEAILRTLQHITDSNDCLKSDYFGRTDTPVVTYSADGQLGSITRGLDIRGATGLNDTLPVTFVDLFTSLSKIFSLGMGIESVSGVDKVVIETLSYFFDSAVIIDLSSRVKTEMIGKEVMAELHYNRIKTGYNSYEYPEALADGAGSKGTLAEFNTQSQFTTVISVIDNEKDLVSKFRADTQGIINLRKAGATGDDEKGDENIFVVDAIRKVLSPYWTARTSEDFTLVTGGIDADSWYNLDLTPKRNLIRNGAIIRAGLEKNLGTFVRWQTTEKNTTLQTQRTAETAPVIENADMYVNELAEPWFLPEIYTCEVEMKYADLSTILTNQKGLIKLAADKYGWIMQLTVGSKENKAELRLLRCNLNKVIPT